MWTDDNGQLTLKREFEWTSFGQLASVNQTSAPAVETFLATGQLAPTVPGIPQSTRFHSSDVTATFEFDAGGNRARQVLDRLYNTNDHATVITRYLGSYELEEHVTFQAGGGYGENKILHRHRLGGASYLKETDASGTKLYLSVTLTDHIGSTDAVLRAEWDSSNQQWKLSSGEPRAERQSFGAWGERREQSDWTDSRTAAADPYQTTAMSENHGFTGHEMLDDFGLIHMNGRIYDPELGRMLSPDPYVQVPEFSQNFNRYSYVVNNPLKLTDPSGFSIVGEYFHAKAFLGAREATRDYLASHPNVAMVVTIIVAVVVTIFTAGSGTLGVTGWIGTGTWQASAASAGFVGATSGSFGSAAAGGDAGDILRGAAVGAVQGAITGGVLHYAGPVGTGGLDQLAASPGRAALHIAGHGIVGGLASEALGGKFQDGFLSAAAGAAASWSGLYAIGGTGDGLENVVARTAVAGVVGGTASALGGGKFANGAYTAAFQHLLNAEAEVLAKNLHKHYEIQMQTVELKWVWRNGELIPYHVPVYKDLPVGATLQEGDNLTAIARWKPGKNAEAYRQELGQKRLTLVTEIKKPGSDWQTQPRHWDLRTGESFNQSINYADRVHVGWDVSGRFHPAAGPRVQIGNHHPLGGASLRLSSYVGDVRSFSQTYTYSTQ